MKNEVRSYHMSTTKKRKRQQKEEEELRSQAKRKKVKKGEKLSEEGKSISLEAHKFLNSFSYAKGEEKEEKGSTNSERISMNSKEGNISYNSLNKLLKTPKRKYKTSALDQLLIKESQAPLQPWSNKKQILSNLTVSHKRFSFWIELFDFEFKQ